MKPPKTRQLPKTPKQPHFTPPAATRPLYRTAQTAEEEARKKRQSQTSRMNAAVTFIRIVALITALVAVSFVFPVITALVCGERITPFAIPASAAIVFASVTMLLTRGHEVKLTTKMSFAVVAVAWVAASVMGALPLRISGFLAATNKAGASFSHDFGTFTDAFFEATSGFSTTGASICREIDKLPRSINLWRCETHWLGGMGIVALTVALLPLLGVGGFSLIKAETTGPEKGKVTSKITTTAKILWLIYSSFTVVQCVLLRIAGMDWIDAVSHAFATLGTGGFSTRGGSIADYNSAAVDWICTAFMFLAGVNFSLYFYAFTGKWADIRKNSELKAYIAAFAAACAVVTVCNLGVYGSLLQSLRYSAFCVASITSTTGFATSDYLTWGSVAQVVVLLLFFVGGSSGSTGGGVKVVRWVVLFKEAKCEMQKMLHPQGVFNIHIDGKLARPAVVDTVSAFMTVYLALVFLTTMIGAMCGLDAFTSFTAALSMVGNVGPAFGTLGPSANYSALAPVLKWWYSFAMLAGRLELYTMIMMLMPGYWKK